MKHSICKRILCLVLAFAMVLPYCFTGIRAAETAVVVDDTVTAATEDHYFTYTSATDPDGMTGWASDTKPSIQSAGVRNAEGNDVAQTQHWIWNPDYAEASKHTYTFTFTGTGVEIVGVKNDAQNTFALDGGTPETVNISGAANTPVVLYSVKDLPYGVHTVAATLPAGGTGLQVCYANVYGASDGGGTEEPASEIATTIRHTKTAGDNNYFTYSDTGWSAMGESSAHVWSDDPGTDPSQIWYSVKFVGHKIDIFAGGNWPMGYVEYFIDGVSQGEFDLYLPANQDSRYITTFGDLTEGEHEFKAVATGRAGAGGRALIDCAEVIVYHAPYAAESITVEETDIALSQGSTKQIRYTVTPDYAELSDAVYTSSDETVATVSKSGLITAVGAGSAVITLSSAVSGLSVRINVTVESAVPGLAGSIVDIDTQWTQDRYDEVLSRGERSAALTAWRNDIATSALALASVDSALKNVTVTAGDFVCGEDVIPASAVTATFIRSTQAYNGGYTWQNYPYPNGYNRSESADILWTSSPMDVAYNAVQPVWVEIAVPEDAAPGTYTGTLTVTAEGLEEGLTFTYTLTVQDAVLPDATEFVDGFDVELWQYPYSSAEYYGVEPFSDEHLQILRSGMEIYKSIGGHAITTTIQEEAWEGQTYSQNSIHYPSMIRWEKVNGEMTYDYSHFDAWVTLCKEMGIGDKIVLYSIAPWHNSIKYWENGVLKSQSNSFGSSATNAMWTHFLTDLIAHLESKGWFDDAYIGIDERGFSTAAFDLIDSIKGSNGEPLKTAGAMDGFVDKWDLALRVTDLNVGDTAAAEHPARFAELLDAREAKGYRTTIYSCTGHQPGNFSLCDPVESYWIILNAGRMGTVGFLRWAYDAWVADPLNDTTHSNFEAGDCFLIFPDEKTAEDPVARRSVRLARIAEGVRDINKLMFIEKEVPALASRVEEVYDSLAYTMGRYGTYTCPDVNVISADAAAFKAALNDLTERYVAYDPNACANGHTEEVIPGVEPTFDAPGLSEGKRCAVCGQILAEQVSIPARDYNEGIIPLNVLNVSCGDYETAGGASEGPAYLAVDDNLNTLWHTDWYGTSRADHWFQFEITEDYAVDGLRYKPRVTGNSNGTITRYDIQVSDDGETFRSVASGNWENDRNWKVAQFDAETVKFVRLVAVDAVTDNSYVFASAAEIRLTGVKAEAHEHSFGDWTVTTAPTCTEAGVETRSCECGETENREIPALGHTEEVIPGKAPTCTESGLTEGKKCVVCGEILTAQEVVPALGHSYGSVVTEPTCTEQGYTTHTCAVCGDSYVDSYSEALGHQWKGTKCENCDATRENPFVDVPEDSFYIDPVLWAVEKGITTGTDATHFNPNGQCQRAVVVTFLWRAAGSPEPASTTNPFTDVKETDFFYKAVLWAVEKGITNGISATEFGPYSLCNRAQVVTFLYRSQGSPAVESTENPFSDVNPAEWYGPAVLWAVEKGVTNGMGDGTFGIGSICNRAQVVTFLYRTLA